MAKAIKSLPNIERPKQIVHYKRTIKKYGGDCNSINIRSNGLMAKKKKIK